MDTSSSTTKVRFTVLVISLISLKSILIGRSLKSVDVKDVAVKVDPSFVPKLGKKCDKFPSFPQHPALRPLMDIPLPNKGVFLSCAEVGVNILDPEDILLECYYRTSYASNTISKVYLDGNFHIASDIELEIMEGQDPRVFDWKGKVHVTDNIAFNNKIKEMNDIGHQENNTWKVPNSVAPYKNVSPIPVNDHDAVMFADFEAENLFRCRGLSIDDLTCTQMPNVEWHYEKIGGAKTTGWKYRGGSAGVKIAGHTFIGFGHLTDTTKVQHDIFTWMIKPKPHGNGTDVIMSYVNTYGGEQYDHRITDPTTLLCMNGGWHVITAESDDKWGHDQGYYQRVYRVVEDDVSDHLKNNHYDDVPLPKIE